MRLNFYLPKTVLAFTWMLIWINGMVQIDFNIIPWQVKLPLLIITVATIVAVTGSVILDLKRWLES